MIKQYTFPPGNWPQISQGMIISEDEIVPALLGAKRWFFYDTCALMHHAHGECSDAMIKYIKKSQGIVILLQSIIIELSSQNNGNTVLQEHQQYIKKLMDYDISVVFMAEENCCKILRAVMQRNRAERNEHFTYAIRHLKGGNSGTGKALDALSDEEKKRMVSGEPVQEELGDHGIRAIRELKQQGDSLGEEMIFYCMIMLAALLCPMVVLSDDKSAFDRFCRAAGYIKEHYKRKEMQYYSSVHLCHIMFQQGILAKDKVEDFLKAAYGGEKISFRGITAQDIGAEEKKVSVTKMAALIRDDKELRILI
ncbi:MAG: hypothetical protein K2P64_13410 [Lachnospiraceae bacterium]|nr:hypothetical protein [Lachnospiraceae bacterium]